MNQEFNDELKYLELRELVEKADNAVAIAVAATAATGAIPIPFADMPLLIGEQVAMMASICAIFKIDIKKDGLKALASAAIGAGGAGILGKTIATNLLKIIPGVGSVAGGVISAGTAGVITFAVGKAFIEVCKANKMGKLSGDEILSSKGLNMMKKSFRDNIRNKKDINNSNLSEMAEKLNKTIQDTEEIYTGTARTEEQPINEGSEKNTEDYYLACLACAVYFAYCDRFYSTVEENIIKYIASSNNQLSNSCRHQKEEILNEQFYVTQHSFDWLQKYLDNVPSDELHSIMRIAEEVISSDEIKSQTETQELQKLTDYYIARQNSMRDNG